MRVQFEFSNGLPRIDFDSKLEHSTPLELSVPSSASSLTAKQSVAMYVQSLNYLFRGVSNYASGRIVKVVAEKGWFGRIEKSYEAVFWEAVTDKTFVVVYDLSLSSFTEHMYVADGLSTGSNPQGFLGVDPLWIKELLSPSTAQVKENIISSIAIATEFLSDYKLVWGFGGAKGLSILDANNRAIKLEDIQDDQSFILISLLLAVVSKGIHTGVFLLDCQGFSDAILTALVRAAKVFFGDAYIFLYNVPAGCRLPRARLELPDLTV